MHIIHMFLGEPFLETASLISQYILRYGDCELHSRFTTINWVRKDDQTVALTMFEIKEGSVCKNTREINTEAEIRDSFSVIYNSSRAMSNHDEEGVRILIHLPLYEKESWEETQKIIRIIGEMRQSFSYDIMGLDLDFAKLFLDETEITSFIKSFDIKSRIETEVIAEVIKFKNQSSIISNFIVFQNYNSRGECLAIDQNSFVAIIGELTLLLIDNFYSVFSINTASDDISAFGISALYLDKFYFINYLISKTYLNTLDSEQIMQEEVDISKVSQIAQECLSGINPIVSKFYKENVSRLVDDNIAPESIIAIITPLIKQYIQNISETVQSFFKDATLSLPEKQATLAVLLGLDDTFLKGYLYDKKKLIIDDCFEEPVEMYLYENNILIKELGVENAVGIGLLVSPINADGEGIFPLEVLKSLKATIMQSSSYIREQEVNLSEYQKGLTGERESTKRLTENGFRYEETTYQVNKLIPQIPFKEKYVASGRPSPNVDLRPLFMPIKDQGQLGSCTVFSITSIFEYSLKRSGKECSFSERFVFYNTNVSKGNIDQGNSYYNIVEDISQNGICTAELCPYDISQIENPPTREAILDAKNHTILEAKSVEINHNDIVSALSEGFPVAISLKIYSSFGNKYNGFIFRPTKEEIDSEEEGGHAMVICGFSESEKVYIVRNSWGQKFGDKGYCYIPFSYIDDPQLNQSACIITKINDCVPMGGVPKMKVSFSETDTTIRYALLKIMIDEEKINLAFRIKKYEKTRKEYDSLLLQLGNQHNRNTIIEETRSRLLTEIDNIDAEYAEYRSSFAAKINDFDCETRSNITKLIISSAATGIGGLACLFYSWNRFYVDWILLVVAMLISLWCIVYYLRRKHEKVVSTEILKEEGAQILSRKASAESQLKNKPLKLHISGMIIDHLIKLQNQLINKNQGTISYVGNLKEWYREESEKLIELKPNQTESFISVLDSKYLDVYFATHKDEITKDIRFSEYLNSYNLSDEMIIAFKVNLKNIIAERLNNIISNFSFYEYILKLREYDYIDNTLQRDYLSCLDKKSDIFLQNLNTTVGDHLQNKTIFINAPDDLQNKWRALYGVFFQTTPNSGNILSKNKIIVISTKQLSAKNLKLHKIEID